MAVSNKLVHKKLIRAGIIIAALTAIGAVSVVTPIFSQVGTRLLSIYSKITLPNMGAEDAKAIIVLGGGLTSNRDGEIILNHYSRSRADTAIRLQKLTGNNIITSGVESPWLSDYIKQNIHNDSVAILPENASMNTCENARFTAKLLSYHELPMRAYLVTDRYHMARAQRQFALAGISTIAYPAALAIDANWLDIKGNLAHSRRTVYELAAIMRDIIAPQNDCRSASDISIDAIITPRRAPHLF